MPRYRYNCANIEQSDSDDADFSFTSDGSLQPRDLRNTVIINRSRDKRKISEIIQHHIWVQIFKFLPLRTLLALACRRNISAIYAALIHSEHYIGPLTVSEKRGRNGKIIGNRVMEIRGKLISPVYSMGHTVTGSEIVYNEKPIPVVSPPKQILGFEEIVFSGYIGRDAFHFLNLCKSLLVKNTELTFVHMCNFLSHYSLPTIDKFLGFFASPTSILKIKFGAGTDRVPAAFFKLQSLLRYGAICIEKSARFVNLEYLVDWLHYFQLQQIRAHPEQRHLRQIVLEKRLEVEGIHDIVGFGTKFVEEIKKRFLAAKEGQHCSFIVVIKMAFSGAANRLEQFEVRNDSTGEALVLKQISPRWFLARGFKRTELTTDSSRTSGSIQTESPSSASPSVTSIDAEVDETTFQRPVTQWNVTKRKTSVFVDYVIKGDATNN